jgi:hypothetical protein
MSTQEEGSTSSKIAMGSRHSSEEWLRSMYPAAASAVEHLATPRCARESSRAVLALALSST